MPKVGVKTVAAPRGIKWSAPVLVRQEAKGLSVLIPAQVIAKLGLGVGDVLNFTELPEGSVEVWRVAKSAYASLDQMPAPAATAPRKKTARKDHSTGRATGRVAGPRAGRNRAAGAKR